MHKLLALIIVAATAFLARGANTQEASALQILSSCQLHDYGLLEIPGDKRDTLISWATAKGLSGFNAVTDHAQLGGKAIALFSITASDAVFYEISLSALNNYSEGDLPESYLSAVLMPAEQKRGLLAVHFHDERLQSALTACLKKLPTDSSIGRLIKLNLSGEQAESVAKHAGDGGYPERYKALAKRALEGKVPSLPENDFNSDNEQHLDGPSQMSPWGILTVVIITLAVGLLWWLSKRRA